MRTDSFQPEDLVSVAKDMGVYTWEIAKNDEAHTIFNAALEYFRSNFMSAQFDFLLALEYLLLESIAKLHSTLISIKTIYESPQRGARAETVFHRKVGILRA